ncbi:3-hydroxyacyl-CoA dehydrogenase family protein [Halalkalibacter krulwichiae]|uniref:Putative 3-hydroxybutyryl-CoA dehydrogenase n=1 Tax=Halalkalibacter krulwichiae TaxID=199441 RepID=A0A1X9M643_9BACI|nr:3-hydroxyacyl-CoA dehydrogenase family protein [Halalkalibacter krulwichiae]ARK28909.1 putative 3-hydroxybutyryl-CoA dehydrogenase [Halalkalibacter krulwichiae]
MTNKAIVIVGGNLLAKELLKSFELNGCSVFLNDFSKAKQIDVVIETTNVDLEQKKLNLQEIESVVSPNTIILSTTLQVTATEAASWLRYPERLIGFATFSNFSEGKVIEVAAALQSDTGLLSNVKETFGAINQEVEVVEDEVGLVYPRILSLIINEAAFALTEGTANAKDIDTAMKQGTNYPLGPLEWAERIGIDDVYAVLIGLHKQFGEERYRPAPLIKKLVQAGWTGGESEKGFHHYQNRRVKEFSI